MWHVADLDNTLDSESEVSPSAPDCTDNPMRQECFSPEQVKEIEINVREIYDAPDFSTISDTDSELS